MAELTCTEAISRNSHDLGEYDSLGLVHLKMKQWDKAIADYNQSLYYRSDLTLSVYGRGLAKRAKGDVAGGNADIAAATRDEPDIANIMTRLGAPAV
jgi:tetratricopeptide (TPR) repeat protein